MTIGAENGDRLPARPTAEGIIIVVHLTPKAGADQIGGVHQGPDGAPFLKARVRALPEKGYANAALASLLADWLDQPASRCEIVAGGKSRLKQVLVRGEAASLMDHLKRRIAGLKSGKP